MGRSRRLSDHHPLAFLRTGWKHRSLIVRLARRKVQARYRGSLLGSLWAWIQPLLLLSVYTFVFGLVFKTRWGTDSPAGATPFALAALAGMIYFTVFSECINEAPTLMIANQAFIRQVRFPVEVLPWVSLLASLFTFAVNLALLLVFEIFVRGRLPWTIVLVPGLVVPLLLLTLGATWALSSAGVFLRDLGQIAGVATTALLFLSPIFYPATRIPEQFQPYYRLNPFVTLIEAMRAALFEQHVPELAAVAAVGLVGWLVAWLGFLGFMKSKDGFADVL
jgi:homopolymeric O-antigen transport system permease protein